LSNFATFGIVLFSLVAMVLVYVKLRSKKTKAQDSKGTKDDKSGDTEAVPEPEEKLGKEYNSLTVSIKNDSKKIAWSLYKRQFFS